MRFILSAISLSLYACIETEAGKEWEATFFPIIADFGVSVATVQWLSSAYMLRAAVMIPVSVFAYRSIFTGTLFLLSVSLRATGSFIGGTGA